MTQIDITKPLEAVRKSDGRVVPVTFKDKVTVGNKAPYFRTNETACSSTTNQNWNYDGTDVCNNDAWIIRNRIGNLDLTRPMQTRNGDTVTLLSDKAAGDNPLVFQLSDGVIFSRPLNGRCFADGHDMPSDVINVDVETKERMLIMLDKGTIKVLHGHTGLERGIIVNVKRTNGKVTDVEFVEAGSDA